MYHSLHWTLLKKGKKLDTAVSEIPIFFIIIQTIQGLSKLGLCGSHVHCLRAVEELRVDHDKPVLGWKEKVERRQADSELPTPVVEAQEADHSSISSQDSTENDSSASDNGQEDNDQSTSTSELSSEELASGKEQQ